MGALGVQIRGLAGLIAFAGLVAGEPPYPYSPANYFSNFAMSDVEPLTVFLPNGKTVKVSLPQKLAHVAFGPDGKSLYGSGGIDIRHPRSTEKLVKIEFEPLRTTDVPGGQDFGIFDFAVAPAEDKIIISGFHGAGASRTCGLFELKLPAGAFRQLSEIGGCDYPTSFTGLSVPPGAERMLAQRHGKWELMDLRTGALQELDREVWLASWSPDGKWIAAVSSYKRSRLVLLDADNPSRRRDLGHTGGGLYWSPDSRYLLLYKDELRCGLVSEIYSMERLDVRTGRREIVKPARCQIYGGLSGWVSNEIAGPN